MYERDCRFSSHELHGLHGLNALAEKGILDSLFCLYIGDNHSHKKE
jgi:hypothetical protein